MKIRNDFVSNSSSSSYIVIANDGLTTCLDEYVNNNPTDHWYSEYQFPSKTSDYQFGWENCMYTGIVSKLNFIGIQVLTLIKWKLNDKLKDRSRLADEHLSRLDEYIDRIRRVLKGLNINARLSANLLRYHIDGNYFSIEDAYIDHKSAVDEGQNMEMLDSDKALTNFLKYDDSYIQGGNDNE